MNYRFKTFLFLAALSALLVVIGGRIGGNATWIFVGIALVMNLGAYLFSDTIVLRMSRARVVDESEAPALHALVRDLATRADLPMPKVAIVADPTPNAFATGRNPKRAVVAVTEGLLHLVDAHELRGVIAHELGHVANRDTLVATIAASAAAAIGHIGNMLQWGAMLGGPRDGEGERGGGLSLLLVGMLAPLAAVMMQMGISRSREFLADEFAARLTGDPRSLASALQRLQGHGQRLLAA
ncbi:MAG: M48 family metalloprotease, partial [Planctomycetes bacterium]|nr:M48 family metalloprotease [Planctomycetota bacterium]